MNRFDDFWTVWPRKIAKAPAKKAWDKLNCDDIADTIIAAVERQVRFVWIGKERKFIPHPASWLNAGRWDDEVEMPDREYKSEAPPEDPTVPHAGLLGAAKAVNVCIQDTNGVNFTTEQLSKLIWTKNFMVRGIPDKYNFHLQQLHSSAHQYLEGPSCPF